MGKGKGMSKSWAKAKFLFKEKELGELVQRLKKAKSMLGLAVDPCSM